MSSDWLSDLPGLESEGPDPAAQLEIIRTLLARDTLSRLDWEAALQDLATMVQRGLMAHEAMVAIWTGEPTGHWRCVTHTGQALNDAELSTTVSRSALDRVRETGIPLIAPVDPLLAIDSASIRSLQASSMLVVPLWFWDMAAPDPERRFGGCLYAHRVVGQASFVESHVALVTDIARIAQPVLNLLRHLDQVSTELAVHRRELSDLQARTRQDYRLGTYTSRDPWFGREVIEPLKRVGTADRINILLLGPTGSGKTHLAEAWHYESARSAGPFVVLDCAQVTSAETLSAGLFGYAADSGYANAPRAGRPGKAQLAHRGTLFIDEVACLPPDLQQKLLRLIERGEFTPLGGSELKRVDLQVVSATLENLPALVRERRFREDLYWRLTDLVVTLPPLNAREADIPELARGFLAQARKRTGRKDVETLSDRALNILIHTDWSRAGNLRGLERTLFRSVLMADPGTPQIDARHLQLQDIQTQEVPLQETTREGGTVLLNPGPGPAMAVTPPSQARSRLTPEEENELNTIKAAIRTHRFATEAARALGLSYRELTWRLHRVGLSIRDVMREENG